MKRISEMDISDKMKLRIINKEIHGLKRKYIEKLKIEDPKSYREILRE